MEINREVIIDRSCQSRHWETFSSSINYRLYLPVSSGEQSCLLCLALLQYSTVIEGNRDSLEVRNKTNYKHDDKIYLYKITKWKTSLMCSLTSLPESPCNQPWYNMLYLLQILVGHYHLPIYQRTMTRHL